MTQLTGKEPEHWHDDNGRHRMTDPRTMPGWSAHMDADEKAFLAHLKAHETVERSANDSPAVSALFDMVDNAEATIEKARSLIMLHRRMAEYKASE